MVLLQMRTLLPEAVPVSKITRRDRRKKKRCAKTLPVRTGRPTEHEKACMKADERVKRAIDRKLAKEQMRRNKRR